MDYAMPICNGLDSTVKIKAYLARQGVPSKDIPFICCLTSYKDRSFKDSAFSSGMDGFMTKPVFKSGISRLVKTVGLI